MSMTNSRNRLLAELIVFPAFFLWATLNIASASCIDNFEIQQKKLSHGLSTEDLKQVEALAKQGQAAKGWERLGRLGDTYAAIAAQVLAPQPRGAAFFYKKLIRNHWLNVNSPALVDAHFQDTAQQHFRQYVKILRSGSWPDSDQILMSYLKAVRDHGLPDITVFDAAWDAAGFNSLRSWQRLNHLPTQRIVFPTNACFKVDKKEAEIIILKDFSGIPASLIFGDQ